MHGFPLIVASVDPRDAAELCWYDWQMWSDLPKLFEQVGSLRLLSQEGMEGQQRLNNEISKRSNGWSNAGRIPNAISERTLCAQTAGPHSHHQLTLTHTGRVRVSAEAMGDIAKAAYMRVRAKLKPKPAEWMYQQQLLHFLADADETQSAAKALAATEEGTMDWRDEFTPCAASHTRPWASHTRSRPLAHNCSLSRCGTAATTCLTCHSRCLLRHGRCLMRHGRCLMRTRPRPLTHTTAASHAHDRDLSRARPRRLTHTHS
jgi:hypothetical protein